MTSYLTALTEAMAELGAHPSTLFLGQAVRYPGTGMHQTLQQVPPDRLIELPVMENAQLGFATGLALAGYLPIAIYPRINFLLEAASQLVQHLDKLPLYGNGYAPRVLIRTAVATDRPLDPGPQHLGDYTAALRAMLSTVRIRELVHVAQILPAYREAARSPYSTILVEYHHLYGT